jgi:hypothetical protein
MLLDDFHKMVSFELRRGTSSDSQIPNYTKQAVEFLETNAPMKWMEEWVNVGLEPGDQVIDFNWEFRNWKFLRRDDGSGGWFYLQKRDPREEQTTAGPTLPETYSQIGMRYVRFDSKWQGPGDLLMEGMVYKFSDWQTTRPDYRHFLLDKGSGLLLYQTMLRIAASVKDPRLDSQYRPLRDEALKAFFSMDTDAQYEGSQDEIVYGGIYR